MSKSNEKLKKKVIKAELKRDKHRSNPANIPLEKSSLPVRYSEYIKGVIYIVLSFSMILAILLGQKGIIITLDDIIDNLMIVYAGKIILLFVALGLFIYGLKTMKLIR